MSATLRVRHNIEVAHRLSRLPGRCEAIHGHSMWAGLELAGAVNGDGLLEGLDFGEVKRAYRAHLDTEYDHRLLLDDADALAALHPTLPGLRRCPGDPTTEHIAQWIADWASRQWPQVPRVRVVVNETHVNAATFEVTR